MSEINGQEIMKRRAPMNSMIKAVLFDLDDTLYCEYDYVDQAFRAVAEKVYWELEKEIRLKEAGACSVSNIHRRMWELLEENGRGRIFDDICAEYDMIYIGDSIEKRDPYVVGSGEFRYVHVGDGILARSDTTTLGHPFSLRSSASFFAATSVLSCSISSPSFMTT